MASEADPLTLLEIMRDDIEAMAGRVEQFDDTNSLSRSKTRRGMLYVTIANGWRKDEGAPMHKPAPLENMIRLTISSAQVQRDQISGPALLTWRARTYDDRGLWVRLAFEALD